MNVGKPGPALDDADVREDGPHRLLVELLVLRREGIHVGRQHERALAVQPLGCVGGAGEDRYRNVLEVRTEEVPGAVDLRVAAVVADVAAPGGADPAAKQVLDEARRLRVMADDDVSFPDQGVDGDRVLARDALEERRLLRAQLRAVAGRTVERVVDPLGQAEKVGRPLEDEPARINAEAADIAKERAEHLGYTAAGRRRVDVPDAASAEQFASGGGFALERPDAVGVQELGEGLDGSGVDVDFEQREPPLARRVPGPHEGGFPSPTTGSAASAP